MNNSSRAPPPPPLNLGTLPPPKLDAPMTRGSVSGAIPIPAKRVGTFSSETSSTGSFSSSLPSSFRKTPGHFLKSPTVNVHTTCGRHTDQFFFGGPSLKDLARSIKNKF